MLQWETGLCADQVRQLYDTMKLECGLQYRPEDVLEIPGFWNGCQLEGLNLNPEIFITGYGVMDVELELQMFVVYLLVIICIGLVSPCYAILQWKYYSVPLCVRNVF